MDAEEEEEEQQQVVVIVVVLGRDEEVRERFIEREERVIVFSVKLIIFSRFGSIIKQQREKEKFGFFFSRENGI